MKALRPVFVLALFALPACGPQTYPEGRYPCTVPAECPPNWYCRTDHLCWSHPEEIDAAMPDSGVPNDAFAPDAGPPDAFVCTPVAETCNDTDDDCDGMIDEDLAVVGEPVVFEQTVDTLARAPHLVGVRSGFIVLWAPGSASGGWRSIGLDGAPLAPAVDWPGSVFGFDAAFDGSRILATLDSFNAFTVPSGQSVYVMPMQPGGVLADVTSTRASAYGVAWTSSPRVRLDTSTYPDAMVLQTVSAGVCDPDESNAAAVRAGNDELFVCGVNDGPIALRRGGVGDATGDLADVGPIAPAISGTASNDFAVVAMAVRDTTMPVSETNPLAVVWMHGQSAPGANVTSITQVTSLSPFVAHTEELAGSFGIPDFGGYYHGNAYVDVVAAPDSSAGHWFVAAAEPTDATTMYFQATVHVWEVSNSHPDGRMITVPSNGTVPATDLSFGVSGHTVRLAAPSPTGLATRSVGCH